MSDSLIFGVVVLAALLLTLPFHLYQRRLRRQEDLRWKDSDERERRKQAEQRIEALEETLRIARQRDGRAEQRIKELEWTLSQYQRLTVSQEEDSDEG
jgi:hypothetical protein